MGTIERPVAVATTDAPGAVGPYSQGTAANGLLFVSGQLPLDPAKGSFVEGDIQAMTRRCLENIRAIVEAGGSAMDRVLKVNVFLADMADFAAVNEVYATFFPEHRPARAAVQVAALPLGARIEIECVAQVAEKPKKKSDLLDSFAHNPMRDKGGR